MLINKMDDIKFFNQTDAIMPTPLVIENRQRPVGPFFFIILYFYICINIKKYII